MFRFTVYRIDGGPHSLELSDLQMRSAKVGQFDFDVKTATLLDLLRRVEEKASIETSRQEYHCLLGRKLKWRFDGRIALSKSDGFDDSMNLMDVMNGYVSEGMSWKNNLIGVRFLPGAGGSGDYDTNGDGARFEVMRALVGAAELRTAQAGMSVAGVALETTYHDGFSATEYSSSQDKKQLPLNSDGIPQEMAVGVVKKGSTDCGASDEPSHGDGLAGVGENGIEVSATAAPSEVRLWLRGLDYLGTNSGRFERHATAFEREFDRLEDVALSADQEGVEGILRDCCVATRGDRARIWWAIKKLSRPD
uniref:Uncharacterized protein n=1 Tax=Odontella aurita TaxID=265563 RepID=A0A6U6FJB3_9STRA